jgi:arginine repressor
MKTYTLGEIVRLGLLKNHEGVPYKHKATIARIISTLGLTKTKTPWGEGYAITEEIINKLNSRWD